MKRYLLFYGDTYYPRGGANDIVGSTNTIRQGLKILINLTWT